MNFASSTSYPSCDTIELFSKRSLPGGPKFQKGGFRLEHAFYKALPSEISENIKLNVTYRSDSGSIVAEYDMLYINEITRQIISFEIKGVNAKTLCDRRRRSAIIRQGIKQKQILLSVYPDYYVTCIYCFVTGKSTDSIDPEFIREILSCDINVATGDTPQQCAHAALELF